MDAGAHPKRRKTRFLPPHPFIKLHHLPVDGEARPESSLRCILQGNGGAEERRDPVTRELVYRPPYSFTFRIRISYTSSIMAYMVSGLNFSDRGVKPFMSQNITVTCLFSPSILSR